MSQNIFISYRRTASEGFAGRIFEHLQTRFGTDRVFMDVANVGIAEDFSDVVNRVFDQCQVVIVLISPHWLSITDEMGLKRLNDPHDFVRMELRAALDREILIVPVLLDGAKMPKSEDLPYELRDLAGYKPVSINQRLFSRDIKNLISELEGYLGANIETVPAFLSIKPEKRFSNRFRLIIFSLIGVIIVTSIWFVWNSRYPMDQNQPSFQSRGTVVGVDAGGDFSEEKNETMMFAIQSPTETISGYPTATSVNRSGDAFLVTASPATQPDQTITSLESKIIDPTGVEMILIPQGSFIMGTDSQELWEKVSHPAHLVGLDMFYIDMYEVSNAQFTRCVEDGKCRGPVKNGTKTRVSYYRDPQFSNYPVVYVSWEDAQVFCSWRGGRLPSEAEWEKAARGDRQLIYPWGESDVDCGHANFWPSEAEPCKGDTAPVDSLPAGASPYGVWHMSGNVQEWVSDWLKVYPGGDPKATKEYGMTHKVIRGGAYIDGEKSIQTTSRKGLKPEGAYSYVGFRCVIDIKALP